MARGSGRPGMILTELEGFEAVDDQRPLDVVLGGCELVEQEAVAPQAAELAVDRAGADGEVAGDLAVGHGADGFHEEAGQDLGSLEPVGAIEGLGTEGSPAGQALVTLDALGVGLAPVEAVAFDGPLVVEALMVLAIGIGAERGKGWLGRV